jgi:hypothetical protein
MTGRKAGWGNCLLGLMILLLSACASVPVPAPAPKAVGSWIHLGSQDFESKHPGLGRGESYASPVGRITVYHYGLGRRDWQTGTRDPGFAEQFDLTMAEIRHHEAQGIYQAVSFEPVRDLRVGSQEFRAVRFFFFSRGEAQRSVTYLSAQQGQLLKLRVTMPTASDGDIDQLTQLFILRYSPQPGNAAVRKD